MDTETDAIEHRQPSRPAGIQRFFQFSLRSLFWAITFWAVMVVAFTRLGLVEALEAVLSLTALLVLVTWFRREFIVERRRLPALLTVLHVLITLMAIVVAFEEARVSESWTWQCITTWAVAGVLMFPVALLHHFVCLLCGWHSGLAQPGTFLLVVVLNSLLWASAGRWMQINLARVWLPLSLFLLAAPASNSVHVGQWLLYIDIEEAGTTVLTGDTSVPENTPVQQIWGVLVDLELLRVDDNLPSSTGSDPETVTLSGKVRIHIKGVERSFGETTVSGLKVVRYRRGPWKLAAGEGERIRGQVTGR